MKRKTLAFIMIILSVALMFLPASSIEVIGYGKTREAAIDDAYASLGRTIRVSVSSLTTSKSSESDKSSSYSFEESTNLESDIEDLIGVKLGNPVQKNGEYSVKAMIAEDNAALYAKELKNMSSSMKDMLRKTETSRDISEKLGTYESLYRTRLKYDTYKTVLGILDRSQALSLDDSTLPTAESILNTFRMEYKANQNTVMIQTMALKAESEMDVNDAAIEEAYRKAAAEYEATTRYLKELEAEQKRIDEFTKKGLSDDIASYISKLDEKTVRKAGEDEFVDPSVTISIIEGSYRAPFSKSRNELETKLASHFNTFCKEAEDYALGVYGRPYQQVEITPSTGLPNAFSLEARVIEVEKGLGTRYNVAYRSAQEIYDAMYDKLALYSSNAEKELETLGKKKIELSTLRDPDRIAADIDINKVDLKNGTWTGTARFPFGDIVLTHPFTISYSAWTGKRVPAITDIAGFNEYRLDFDRLNSIFTNASNAIEVRLTYRIEGTLKSNIYNLYIERIEVWDPMKDRQVWFSAPNTLTQLSIGPNNVDMTDLTVENEFQIKSRTEKYAAPTEKEISNAVSNALKGVELPKADVIEKKVPVTRTITEERSTIKRIDRSLSVDLGLGTDFEAGISRNCIPISLGMTKMSSKPFFADTRGIMSANIMATLDFRDIMNGSIGCEIDLGFISQITSAFGIEYGIKAGFDADYSDFSRMSLSTSGMLGFTMEGVGSVKTLMQVKAFGGVRFDVDEWKPIPMGGLRLSMGFFVN